MFLAGVQSQMTVSYICAYCGGSVSILKCEQNLQITSVLENNFRYSLLLQYTGKETVLRKVIFPEYHWDITFLDV